MGGKTKVRMILGGKRNGGRKPKANNVRRSDANKGIWNTPEFHNTQPTAAEVLARPAYINGLRLNQFVNWSEEDKVRLRVLVEAGVDVTKAADTLGRNETTLIHKAREERISVPTSWNLLLPKAKYTPRPREARILLNYPFMISVKRDRDADLIVVNSVVPKGIPEHMRGDICQDILLAIYEGKVNVETLQKRPDIVKQYVSAWRKSNLERGGYGMMSIDPYGDDQRSWEEQAAAKADWDWNQMQDARSNWEVQSLAFTPATQFDEAYEKEIHRERMAYAERGIILHHKEVELRLDRGEKLTNHETLIADRIRIGRFIVECDFELSDRRVLDASYTGEVHNIRFAGQSYSAHHVAALQTQYISFSIPGSRIRPLEIRVSDHSAKASNTSDLDTHKLGVEGVIRVLSELSEDVGKYEKVYSKWGDMRDLLANGLEGFAA